MFKTLIKRIAKALQEANLPYMIIGGQAVLFYGEPRLTKDIDITLGVDTEALKEVVEVTKKLNFKILINDVDDFVKKTMVLPTEDPSTGVRVDFIFSHSLYEKQAIERAKEVKFGRIPVKMASLEDVVIHKIVAGRQRDLDDVKNLFLKNPVYDRDYIIEWLKKFDESLSEGFLRSFEEIERLLRNK
ncbi:MAG: nucleotidyl transferase AbiEii/AbiGii toxin family protein [Candidatus Anstonellales archaeon]